MKQSLREAFGLALIEEGRVNEKIVAVSCDLKGATKLQGFFDEFPGRSFETGIAEANGIGLAAGLALGGYRPFIASFGSFLTGKNIEIRISIAYNQAPVVLVGTHGGFIGPDGTTQAGLQDIAVMRSIPGMQVYVPGTPLETKAMVDYCCRPANKEMVYLRVARNEVEEVFDASYKFRPGESHIIREGINYLLTTGPMLEECLKLSRQTPGLGVIHFPTVKPIDKRRIADLAERPILLFSVEDHEIQGGFGSAIAEELSQYGGKAQLFRFGLSDEFIRSGAPAQIMKHFRLDSEGLGQRVRGVLEREGFA